MPATLHLEAFDMSPAHAPATPKAEAVVATYEDGYAAGLAAAEEGFAQDQLTLKEALVATLQEASIGYEAARTELLGAVQPLHEALVSALLPELLAPGLILHLRDLIAEACARDLPETVTIRVPAGQADILRAATADSTAQDIAFVEDPSLGTSAVRVSGPEHDTTLDLDAALAAIAAEMAALTTLTDPSTQASTHG